MEEIANKVKSVTDNRVSRRKKKKIYAEVVKSGKSNIKEGIKSGKSCTVLTVNKYGALVRKNSSEAANTPTKVPNKHFLNQNVPQCVDILNETVVEPPLEKELLVASKDSNIIANDNDLVDFESIKKDLLSGENSSKISNNPPVVCTITSVVQKRYD